MLSIRSTRPDDLRFTSIRSLAHSYHGERFSSGATHLDQPDRAQRKRMTRKSYIRPADLRFMPTRSSRVLVPDDGVVTEQDRIEGVAKES